MGIDYTPWMFCLLLMIEKSRISFSFTKLLLKDTEWPDQLSKNKKRELEVRLSREKARHNLRSVRLLPSLHRRVQDIFIPALFPLPSAILPNKPLPYYRGAPRARKRSPIAKKIYPSPILPPDHTETNV